MLLEGNLNGFQHLGIPVVNLTVAKDWYRKLFGFQVVYETTLHSDNGDIKVAFLKLKDIVIELYELSGKELEDIKVRGHGHIDHLAISVNNINAVLNETLSKGAVLDTSTPDGPILLESSCSKKILFVNLVGPNGEIVQLEQQSDMKHFYEKDNINGWAHLGIVVSQVDKSKIFYSRFGFKEVKDSVIKTKNGIIRVSLLEKNGFKLELIQPADKYLDEVKSRKDGHIDHVTLKVADVEKAYKELKAAGLNVIQDSPVFLPFGKNGVKYFNVLGLDGERIEFIQIL